MTKDQLRVPQSIWKDVYKRQSIHNLVIYITIKKKEILLDIII